MQHEHARRTATQRVNYTVTPMRGHRLGEVVVNADAVAGGFVLQDYLTVEQARELAFALDAVADMCEEAAWIKERA